MPLTLPPPIYHMHHVELQEALALLDNPDFRIKDMRMGTDYNTWAVYWEFITPDYHWYRVSAEDHGDPLALELYRACWNYGQRNAPHLYGLLDKKEETHAG